ncbi:hypothetical protein WA1_50225 [Scytonema hofmannii PCC 7110]|uniref:MobA/VirD2-like nuclease domain-containing protein n=1 Tax=Scytonema hofmannii PCC 7110 TaxID=128403 RepID=A0A139WR45_9CYAN|nr:relaxase/mobilization nuclease domain-containing protein [Scytonema hofmannii]KYC34904.1 hypothetical protein WA1_50225 [Scytonema hofmannii PCC 7110]
MIGNITKGNGFYGLCAYVMGKPGAKVIGGNMAGTTPGELAWEFRKFSSLNDRVSQPVLHLSFSPAPEDRLLSDLEYYCIAQDLLDGLKLNKNQYLLALHYDAEYQGKTRPHAHMIINRVNIDGECNDAYKDYYRTELVLRQIEKDYHLISQPSSWEVKHKKAYPKQIQFELETGTPNAITKLQTAVKTAAYDKPAMIVFVARLLKDGIKADVKYTNSGKVKGISYGIGEEHFAGNDLGQVFTFNGLQKHLGVSYDHEQEKLPIQSLLESFRRGRTIDDARIEYLQNWLVWNKKDPTASSSSDGNNQLYSTVETPTDTPSSTPTLTPIAIVTTVMDKPGQRKRSPQLEIEPTAEQPPEPAQLQELLVGEELVEYQQPIQSVELTASVGTERAPSLQSTQLVELEKPNERSRSVDRAQSVELTRSQSSGQRVELAETAHPAPKRSQQPTQPVELTQPQEPTLYSKLTPDGELTEPKDTASPTPRAKRKLKALKPERPKSKQLVSPTVPPIEAAEPQEAREEMGLEKPTSATTPTPDVPPPPPTETAATAKPTSDSGASSDETRLTVQAHTVSKEQQDYARAIAPTVRFFFLQQRQGSVVRGRQYDLQLEGDTIKVSRKSGEEIALVPLNGNKLAVGCNLKEKDLENFRQVQRILSSKQRQRSKDGLEMD